MRIFLTGATGFIGGHVLHALLAAGHTVTCLARGTGATRLRHAGYPGVAVAEAPFQAATDWPALVAGHDAVVNCVGIIRETAGGSFEEIHTHAPVALFEAAAAVGVRKVVQVSALGADEGATTAYHLSKRDADRRLMELGVPYVVLRPSLVYGPGDHSMTFFQSLAALPVTPVPGDGQSQLQPLHVEDLARAVVQAVQREDLRNLTLDLGGADTLSFDALLDTLARRLGKRRALKLHVPLPMMRLAATMTDALGGHGPISSDELSMLQRGNHGDNGPFIQAFGFAPVGLETGLARTPLSQADRWAALLTLLRVPLRFSVAFIWIATGIVSAFLHSTENSLTLLARTGLTGNLALAALYGICLFEIVLGLATAVGWRVRLLGTVQVALMLFFMAVLTVTQPDLWTDPFGPLTKNIPLLGATLAMMALEE